MKELKVPLEKKQPCFILLNPQMGENIGASARGMWNFGLERMRIVSPRDGWPNQKAVAVASGAGRLLDEALIFQLLPMPLLTNISFLLLQPDRGI